MQYEESTPMMGEMPQADAASGVDTIIYFNEERLSSQNCVKLEGVINLTLIHGDIFDVKVEAMVNPANKYL